MELDTGNEVVKDFEQRAGARGVWESYWDDIADLVDPNMSNTFRAGDSNTPGERKTDRQMDSSPTVALTRFAAIMDSLLTPRNQKWHRLVPTDRDLLRDHDVGIYFEELTKRLFQYRYAPKANFSTNNQLVYRGLGSLGTSAMFTDRLSAGKGVRYKACHVGEIYPKENHQGMIDDIIRRSEFSASQLMKLDQWKDNLPNAVREAAAQNSATTFTVLHRVRPRPDVDYEALDERAMPYESVYVLKGYGNIVLESGGYRSFPYAPTRYDQAPGEVYGRSPAMQVLPAIKSLNVQKRVLLTQGHRAMNPVLLVADDGSIQNVSLRPGSVVPGSVNPDGRPLVHTLPTGDHGIGKDLMDDERNVIAAAFLNDLFQLLTENPRMTATEVVKRAQEQGILVSPTVGRQQSEYLGPLIEREIEVLNQQGLLPEMPPALIEAQGDYQVQYDSPLSRMARAEEAAGFSSTMEMLIPILNAGRVEILDNFDFDTITRDLSEIQAVPRSWMQAMDIVEAQRGQRQQQQEALMRAQVAPDMLKAAAAAKKAGLTAQDVQ